MKIGSILSAIALAALACGCKSPLYSEDPEVRKQAMQEVTDQKELFFIAMDIQVLSYETHYGFLAEGKYPDDVRLMAVEKLTTPAYLLKLATWQDGHIYTEATDHNRSEIQIKGTYYYTRNEHDMRRVFKAGDAVRKVAFERLSRPEIFKSLDAQTFDVSQDSIRTLYLPFNYKPEERSVVPVLAKVFEKQKDADVVDVLIKCVDWLAYVDPEAIDFAIAHKLKGADNKAMIDLYRAYYMTENDDSRMYSSRRVDERWALPIYKRIKNPPMEIVLDMMRRSPDTKFDTIIDQVKNQQVITDLLLDEAFVKNIDKTCRTATFKQYGNTEDITPKEAARLLKKVTKQENVKRLATEAKIFAIRTAAIKKITVLKDLEYIARGNILDCPCDGSITRKDVGNEDDRYERQKKAEAMSKARLQITAIQRLKDVAVLREIRKNAKDKTVKEAVTKRLTAIGQNDVADICAASAFDDDLFAMLEFLTKESEILEVTRKAKLKGVRLLAAKKLSADKFKAVIKQERADIASKCGNGMINFHGFFLGMDVQDLYAILLADYPELEPVLYRDGAVCIKGKNGRDIAWADASKFTVHWLTLPSEIVKKLMNVTSGSYDELERAIARKLKVSFKINIMRRGNVRQDIGMVDTIQGENLRFFRAELSTQKDYAREARKSMNNFQSQHSNDFGFGAALANAFEDAAEADENRANAKAPCFAPAGSLQLQYTRNAPKTLF